MMIVTLGILLGLVALICFLGGMNIMLKGAMSFLPKETPPQLVLDDLVRFLAGIYFGSGFLLAYAAFNVASLGNVIYFMGIIVMFSGLGRLYSRYKLGSAGRYFDFIMIFEILLGLIIIALEWLR
jgi:hypothetical protein